MRIIYDSLAELATVAANCETTFQEGKCAQCVLSEVCDPGIKMENRAPLRSATLDTKDGGCR